MSENTSIPTLTLDPNGAQVAAQAVSLEEEIKQAAETAEPAVEKIELEKLSPEEQAAVKEFSSQIDVMNTEQVMNYGAAAQKNISEFSDAALSTVKTKDLGEVGSMLSELVVELKGMKFEEKEKGLKALFKKGQNNLESLKAQYNVAEANVDKSSKLSKITRLS